MNDGAQARAGASHRLHDKRILVVEDDYYIADAMAVDLRALGAEIVGPVSTLADAMAAMGAPGRIDAAVLDVNLQGEPVFPLADALRARGVPFVFATGYDRQFIPKTYERVALCEKPLDARGVAARLFG